MLLPFREDSCGGIPIIISEMAIWPADGANTEPESLPLNPTLDMQEQADFYTMVWALAADRGFHGIVNWQLQPQSQAWSGDPSIPGDLKNLPALEAMRIFYETP